MTLVQQGFITRRLKGEFQGITLKRSETGALTVDVSSLNGVDVAIISNGNCRIVKKTLVEEQINAPHVIKACVDKRAYNIDDVLPDGWVVGPLSPTTGKPMAIEPLAGALEGYQTWVRGIVHAKTLLCQGHAGARLPDEDELRTLYNGVVKARLNNNARFNTNASRPYGKFWSSEGILIDSNKAWIQSFSTGCRDGGDKCLAIARVRCVRDEPGLILSV